MRSTRHAFAIVACALLVAACGGSTGTTDDAGGEAAPASEASGPDAVEEPAPSQAPDEADHEAGGEHGDDAHDPAEAVATDPSADRVVTVVMTEFAFEPSELVVAVGETVQFIFVNEGAIEHEAILGDRHVQDEHEAAMAADGDDHDDGADGHHGDEAEGGHHGEIPAVTVATGEVGSLTHTFEEAGALQFGCHLPGHWDAGMVAEVTVG